MTLNGEMALILRYFTGAHCVKVVEKAITMDNLQISINQSINQSINWPIALPANIKLTVDPRLTFRRKLKTYHFKT